jgi:NAD-dependent deacetylase
MTLTLPENVLLRLKTARRAVVLTGGGMAAEAGVPSFRDSHTGRWAQYDVSELATPQAYLRNPRLVWDWYDFRRRAADAVTPTAAHYALVDMEQYYPSYILVTQTIDGLHWRAGSRDMVELNGCLRRSRCYEAGHMALSWDEDGDLPPRCPHCGSPLRPDVVMFGEGLPHAELRKAQHAVEHCDLFMTVGAVGAIEPVASFPFVAKRVGAFVLSIGPEDSVYSLMADHVIPATPGEVLPELVRQVVGDGHGLQADVA